MAKAAIAQANVRAMALPMDAEKVIFFVDVGLVPPAKAKQVLEDVRKTFEEAGMLSGINAVFVPDRTLRVSSE